MKNSFDTVPVAVWRRTSDVATVSLVAIGLSSAIASRYQIQPVAIIRTAVFMLGLVPCGWLPTPASALALSGPAVLLAYFGWWRGGSQFLLLCAGVYWVLLNWCVGIVFWNGVYA